MQLISQVNIYPRPGVINALRNEQYAWDSAVYIDETLCGTTGPMPAAAATGIRKITVRCEEPVWGTGLTIVRETGVLGFYSVTIDSLGERLVSFADVAQLRATNAAVIEPFALEAASDAAASATPDTAKAAAYWAATRAAYAKTSLTATLKKENTKCGGETIDYPSSYGTVEAAASKILGNSQAGSGRAFAWNRETGVLTRCPDPKNLDEAAPGYDLYVARSAAFNLASNEWAG